MPILALLAALAFVGLTLLVSAMPLLPIDIAVEQALQAATPGWLARLAEAIAWIGFPPQSAVIYGAVAVVIFVLGWRWEAVCAAFAAAGAAGLWFALVPLLHRPRPTPDLVRVSSEIPFGSFPSGHVLDLTAFTGFIVYLSFVLVPPGWRRGLIVTVCVLLLLAMGYARILSGEHWPTDVLGGYLLGFVWVCVSVQLYRWGRPRWGRRRLSPLQSRP